MSSSNSALERLSVLRSLSHEDLVRLVLEKETGLASSAVGELISSSPAIKRQKLDVQQPIVSPRTSSASIENAPVDFAMYNRRYVQFRFLYFGSEYSGFAQQGKYDPNSSSGLRTIEGEFIRALMACRLIDDPRHVHMEKFVSNVSSSPPLIPDFSFPKMRSH